MIDGRVVGHKVKQEPHASIAQPGSQTLQGGVAAKIPMHRVALDGEGRAANVRRLVQVGQDLAIVPGPVRVGPRDRETCGSGLPDAQQPDPVEAEFGDLVERRVGHIVKRGGFSQRAEPGRGHGFRRAGGMHRFPS